MPQARKSSRSSRKSATYKEPAALKRLNQSLESAQKALTELRSHAGGDAAQTTRNLHKGVGKFLKDARRDTGKFTTALKRDFEKAQKAVTGSSAQRSRTSGTSRRRGTSSTGSKRTTGSKRATGSKRTTRSKS